VEQIAASCRWPDSDILCQWDLERIKAIVNIAGVATTSIITAAELWCAVRMAAAALRDVETSS
jgi:hypothetical protein